MICRIAEKIFHWARVSIGSTGFNTQKKGPGSREPGLAAF
jgi:hypothetical protein